MRTTAIQVLAKKVQRIFERTLVTCLFGGIAVAGPSTRKVSAQTSNNVPVVMLSDLHFDPMRDPSKVSLLDRAPVERWAQILETPDSQEQPARFAAVQQTCSGKEGTDSSYALIKSSLLAARGAAPSAAFVTVSGDLLVHDLDCRYRASLGMKASTTDDQSASAAFAEKTTVFVMKMVESAFPRIPVYIALGNNDSRCNHNRLDVSDRYLQASVHSMLHGLRGVSAADKALAERTYKSAGYYAATMPAPIRNTRLIVINDVYMMPGYANCEAGTEDRKGSKEQLAWLQQQLSVAESAHQNVWILGHLPPAVNPSSSLSPKNNACETGRVVSFQKSDELARQMMSNASIIKLGIFGHTHVDEFHLLSAGSGGVPVKVVGSVTPVGGNLPSFTIGLVRPETAELADYSVYTASDAVGNNTQWTLEYSFDSTYGLEGFTSDSLGRLIARLRRDIGGSGKDSRAYQSFLTRGSKAKDVSRIWPAYTCSLGNPASDAFRRCSCSTQ